MYHWAYRKGTHGGKEGARGIGKGQWERAPEEIVVNKRYLVNTRVRGGRVVGKLTICYPQDI